MSPRPLLAAPKLPLTIRRNGSTQEFKCQPGALPPARSRATRRPGGATSQFQRSGSNVDDPLAVARIASRPRRVEKSKICSNR